MYYYILDPHNIDQAKFEKQQIELQGLLAEFRINGEISRVTPLKSIKDCVQIASERGVKTLVACGTDDTFNLMLSHLRGRDFTLGYIPMDDSSYLAKILGIGSLHTAVKTIAARRIEKIDLATLGDSYFISYVEFGLASSALKQTGWWSSLKALSVPEIHVRIKIDDSYTMDINCLGGLVANTRSARCADSDRGAMIANPTDGFLDLLILEKLGRLDVLKYKEQIAEGCLEQVPKTSVIKCRKVEFLQPSGLSLSLSGRIFAKAPTRIEIIPRRQRLIVGKNRTF